MPAFTMDGVQRISASGGQILDLRKPALAGRLVDGISLMSAPATALPALAALPAAPAVESSPSASSRRNYYWLALAPTAVAVVFTGNFAMSRLNARAVQAETVTSSKLAPAVTPSKPIIPPTAYHDPELQKSLNEFAAAQPVTTAIVAKDLKTNKYALVNPDQVFKSASLYKLFVANQIFRTHDYDGLSLSAPTGGGTNRSIQGCLEVMINVSDNACGSALGLKLGWKKQNSALASQGFTHTDLISPYPQTSASDVAKLLEQLYTTEFLKPISNNMFVGYLKNQKVNNRLPTGLPRGTDIAHKTGDLEGVVHDAGIVYGPKTDYLIVVMTGPWSTPGNAPASFTDLSAKLYSYFNQ